MADSTDEHGWFPWLLADEPDWFPWLFAERPHWSQAVFTTPFSLYQAGPDVLCEPADGSGTQSAAATKQSKGKGTACAEDKDETVASSSSTPCPGSGTQSAAAPKQSKGKGIVVTAEDKDENVASSSSAPSHGTTIDVTHSEILAREDGAAVLSPKASSDAATEQSLSVHEKPVSNGSSSAAEEHSSGKQELTQAASGQIKDLPQDIQLTLKGPENLKAQMVASKSEEPEGFLKTQFKISGDSSSKAKKGSTQTSGQFEEMSLPPTDNTQRNQRSVKGPAVKSKGKEVLSLKGPESQKVTHSEILAREDGAAVLSLNASRDASTKQSNDKGTASAEDKDENVAASCHGTTIDYVTHSEILAREDGAAVLSPKASRDAASEQSLSVHEKPVSNGSSSAAEEHSSGKQELTQAASGQIKDLPQDIQMTLKGPENLKAQMVASKSEEPERFLNTQFKIPGDTSSKAKKKVSTQTSGQFEETSLPPTEDTQRIQRSVKGPAVKWKGKEVTVDDYASDEGKAEKELTLKGPETLKAQMVASKSEEPEGSLKTQFKIPGDTSSKAKKKVSTQTSGQFEDTQRNQRSVKGTAIQSKGKEVAVDDYASEEGKAEKSKQEIGLPAAGRVKDMVDARFPEGPIELATQVQQEPYDLHPYLEWTICDMTSDDMRLKVCKFLEKQYPDAKYEFKVYYSKDFLSWALCSPRDDQSCNIGVCLKTSKKLVGFISGVPANIRVRGEVVKMGKINFLCVIEKYRSKGIASVLIKEVTRRIQLRDTWQAVYSSMDRLRNRTPVTNCQYWARMLNPKKLIELEFSSVGQRMKTSTAVRLYKLPDTTMTPGFKEMESSDIIAVTELLREYLSQFEVAPVFDMIDVAYWFLPRNGVVYSYLVRSPENYEITDFCSFYSVPYTIAGRPKYTTVECAYSYYNVAKKTPFPQLMTDVLISSKNKGFDVFYALDVMHNVSFLKDLKFVEGDNAQVRYYLHNYRLRNALKPSEIGLVF